MAQERLAARVRKSKGKEAARKLRKKDKIPAVFYGPKTESIMLAVDYPELERILNEESGENVILNLEIESDKGTETRKAIIKDLTVDAIKNTYLHADFYEISMDREITFNLPLRLINTPVGVKNGGILQTIRRELVISCLPDNLIDSVDIDVSHLDIGDSLHINDIDLPEGIKSAEDGHLTVAVVAAPTVSAVTEEEEEKEEAEAEEEAAAAEDVGAAASEEPQE